jgi:hypothetical protein
MKINVVREGDWYVIKAKGVSGMMVFDMYIPLSLVRLLVSKGMMKMSREEIRISMAGAEELKKFGIELQEVKQ